jgi:hypothetical protein
MRRRRRAAGREVAGRAAATREAAERRPARRSASAREQRKEAWRGLGGGAMAMGAEWECGEEDEAEWRFACRAHGRDAGGLYLYFSAQSHRPIGILCNNFQMGRKN